MAVPAPTRTGTARALAPPKAAEGLSMERKPTPPTTAVMRAGVATAAPVTTVEAEAARTLVAAAVIRAPGSRATESSCHRNSTAAPSPLGSPRLAI